MVDVTATPHALMPSRKQPASLVIGLSGLSLVWVLVGLHFIFRHGSTDDVRYLVTFAAVFAVLAPQAARLPRGASLRSGMAVLLAGMLLLPPQLVVLVPIPGLLIAALVQRRRWRTEALNVGHVSLGLYVGGHVFHKLSYVDALSLPASLPVALLALAVHLLINRFAAALVVSLRMQKPIMPQLTARFAELGWSQFAIHTFAIVLAVMYGNAGLWGLVAGCLPLIGLAQIIAQNSQVPLLRQAALTDGLTGVENRAAWEQLARATAPGDFTGTLVMFDLDHLKRINDTLGHAAGDELLRDFTGTIRSQVRQTDRLFRFGGDEFVLLIPHKASATARIHKHIEQIVDDVAASWQSQRLRAGVSLGIVTLPGEATTLADALQLADARLYADKERNAKAR